VADRLPVWSAGALPYLQAPRTVEWGDCDPSGLIFFPNAFRYAVDAEHAALLASGLEPALVHRLVRASVRADYLAPLRFADVIATRLGVLELGRTSATYVFQHERADEVCVAGRITIVHLDSGRPAELPGELTDVLSRYVTCT
jgi:acyl-CoA thioesterase FadM